LEVDETYVGGTEANVVGRKTIKKSIVVMPLRSEDAVLAAFA
jgi:hypothetical protein